MTAAPVKIRKFLVVSESEEHRQFFKGLLREKQMDVSSAEEGEEALEIVENKRIQFVIVEREMNKMTGSNFIQRLRSNRQFVLIPSILFSTKLTDESIRLCRELGVMALRMPANKEDVIKDIEEICRQEENIDALEQALRAVDSAIAEKQFIQAGKMLKDATQFTAPSARVSTLWGEIHFEQNNLADAEKSLTLAIQQNKTYIPATRLLAKVYSATQRHDKAIELLKTMAEKSPQNIATLLSLAGAYSDAKELENAQGVLARIKELDPGNKSANLELGKIALSQEKIHEAEMWFSELGNVDETARALNTYAIGLVGRDDFEKAIQSYKIAMRILAARQSDKTILLQYNLGLAMKKKKNLEVAFTLLASCCLAEPKYSKAFNSLTSVVKLMKAARLQYDESLFLRIEDAVKELKKAA